MGRSAPCSPLETGDGTQVSPSSEQDDPGPGGREADAGIRRAIAGERAGRGFWHWPWLLAAPLSAIWAVPWFVTQDGPAHVYNAQILAESFDASIAVPLGLHDLVEADPELDGPPRPRRAGLAVAGVDRRSDHDQRDPRGSRSGHALAAVAGGRRARALSWRRSFPLCWP